MVTISRSPSSVVGSTVAVGTGGGGTESSKEISGRDPRVRVLLGDDPAGRHRAVVHVDSPGDHGVGGERAGSAGGREADEVAAFVAEVEIDALQQIQEAVGPEIGARDGHGLVIEQAGAGRDNERRCEWWRRAVERDPGRGDLVEMTLGKDPERAVRSGSGAVDAVEHAGDRHRDLDVADTVRRGIPVDERAADRGTPGALDDDELVVGGEPGTAEVGRAAIGKRLRTDDGEGRPGDLDRAVDGDRGDRRGVVAVEAGRLDHTVRHGAVDDLAEAPERASHPYRRGGRAVVVDREVVAERASGEVGVALTDPAEAAGGTGDRHLDFGTGRVWPWVDGHRHLALGAGLVHRHERRRQQDEQHHCSFRHAPVNASPGGDAQAELTRCAGPRSPGSPGRSRCGFGVTRGTARLRRCRRDRRGGGARRRVRTAH